MWNEFRLKFINALDMYCAVFSYRSAAYACQTKPIWKVKFVPVSWHSVVIRCYCSPTFSNILMNSSTNWKPVLYNIREKHTSGMTQLLVVGVLKALDTIITERKYNFLYDKIRSYFPITPCYFWCRVATFKEKGN